MRLKPLLGSLSHLNNNLVFWQSRRFIIDNKFASVSHSEFHETLIFSGCWLTSRYCRVVGGEFELVLTDLSRFLR